MADKKCPPHNFVKAEIPGDSVDIYTNPDEPVEVDRCIECGDATYRVVIYLRIK